MDFPNAGLPVLYDSANDLSVAMQRRYLHASALRLSLLVAAAVAGALTVKVRGGIDLAGFATALALVGAIVAEGWLAREKPERAWYDGRILAETAKTLSWRFAMGAHPFPRALATNDAERAFVDQLDQLLREAPSTLLKARAGTVLSPPLLSLRGKRLDERRAVYVRDRIAEQCCWYAARSEKNRKIASRWRVVLVTAETAGVAGALLRAIGVVDVDIAGIVAAVAGAGVAWLALKKYEQLAQSYAYSTNALALIEGRLALTADEESWAAEVARAEEAISREHLTWRASRTNATS
jgi:hypothetical protein